MKIDGNAIRPGMVIEHKGCLWRTIKTEHTQPGKSGAYMQVELKDIRTGTKLNERFRASEKVERATLEQREQQYLFSDGDIHTFMDNETYEQTELDTELIGEDQVSFLQDGMVVILESHEGTPLGVQMPSSVVLQVVEADAVVRGQTASSSFKPAVMDNGMRVMVPPHIESGTRIVVNTADRTYIERAKI